MSATPVQITIEDLTQKVEQGWKKPALAAHYGLPMTQMTQALQQAGLRIRKLHHPKFVLVASTTADTTREVLSAQPDIAEASYEDYAVDAQEMQTPAVNESEAIQQMDSMSTEEVASETQGEEAQAVTEDTTW